MISLKTHAQINILLKLSKTSKPKLLKSIARCYTLKICLNLVFDTRSNLVLECDELIIEHRQKYKIEVFFHTIDTAINSLELRFSQITEHSKHFALLFNIYALRELPNDELLEHCKDLELFSPTISHVM